MNFFLKAINDENDLQDMRTLSNRPNVQGKYRLENQQKDEEKKNIYIKRLAFIEIDATPLSLSRH